MTLQLILFILGCTNVLLALANFILGSYGVFLFDASVALLMFFCAFDGSVTRRD